MALSCGKCFQIFSHIVWIGIGIAMIVVGAIYMNECPSNSYTPIYLVVNGVMHMVPILFLLLIALLDKACVISEIWAILPNYVWFIIGTPFVFTTDDDTEIILCDPNLYYFTIGILIFDLVIYVMMILYWKYGSRIRAYCSECCGSYERLE
ncbi:transmembrane protein 272-like isoform X2 [Hyla sarda]|uniref:transmembrane protein 272-like isoform X2 n=1 Tax=Hyla sarda TaxID=327740 RepID=UPI0024C301D9|nr:transmembrane protein 272-like isoform X2 [Hyla sarda]